MVGGSRCGVLARQSAKNPADFSFVAPDFDCSRNLAGRAPKSFQRVADCEHRFRAGRECSLALGPAGKIWNASEEHVS